MAKIEEDTSYLLENYIYLYHLNKFCILPSMPDTITDTMQSRFSDTNALARSAPVQSYSNSGPRSIQFTFDLHRDLMEDLNRKISNLKDNVVDIQDKDYIDVLINYLQACALPKYNVYKTGSKAVDPPQVAIRMGNDIFIRGVVSSGVSVTYKKPILDNGKYASVQVSLSVTEVDPYDAPTVAMVGGFRGVSATCKGGIYKDKSDSHSYAGQEYVTDTNSTEIRKVRTIEYNQKKLDWRLSVLNASLVETPNNSKKVTNSNWPDYLSGQGFGVNGYRTIGTKTTDRYFSGQGFGITGDWGMDSSMLNKGANKSKTNGSSGW